jgi:hypothetical protein
VPIKNARIPDRQLPHVRHHHQPQHPLLGQGHPQHGPRLQLLREARVLGALRPGAPVLGGPAGGARVQLLPRGGGVRPQAAVRPLRLLRPPSQGEGVRGAERRPHRGAPPGDQLQDGAAQVGAAALQEEAAGAVLPGPGLRAGEAVQAAEVPVGPRAGADGARAEADPHAGQDLVPESEVQEQAPDGGPEGGEEPSGAQRHRQPHGILHDALRLPDQRLPPPGVRLRRGQVRRYQLRVVGCERDGAKDVQRVLRVD